MFIQLVVSPLAEPPPEARRRVASDDLRSPGPRGLDEAGVSVLSCQARAQASGSEFLPRPGAEPRRRNEKKISGVCGSMNPARKIGLARKQWIPAKAYSNLSNHCQTWGCPTLPLRAPLPAPTAVKASHRCHCRRALEAHINLFVTAKEMGTFWTTSSRVPTRRYEFLPQTACLVSRPFCPHPRIRRREALLRLCGCRSIPPTIKYRVSLVSSR